MLTFKATLMAVAPRDTVTFERTPLITESYEQAARFVGLALLIPASMIMLTALLMTPFGVGVLGLLFVFSFLHIFVLLAMLALVRAIEKPIADLLLVTVWPLHRRWLTLAAPHTLRQHTQRRAHWTLKPTSPIVLDERAGILYTQNQPPLDLNHPFDILAEHAQNPQTLLRVRLTSRRTGRSAVLSAAAPDPSTGARLTTLPRHDAAAVVLDWVELHQLLHAVTPFAQACGAHWPTALASLCPTYAQNTPQVIHTSSPQH